MFGNRATIEEGRVPPFPVIKKSLIHRVWCFYNLWLAKLMSSMQFSWQRMMSPLPRALRPTIVKRYASRPKLQARIFYPDGYTQGQILPLLICVHAGGFAMLDAESDDEWCRQWSNRTNMLIASLDHSLSPLSTFPGPVHDVAALANSLLEDEDLPIDKKRVVIGGFSSGGNIALGASQMPELQGRIKAAVVFFTVTDFTIWTHDKIKNRPYKSSTPETLETMSWWVDWGYLEYGENRRNPLLSPYWAKKEALPPWICTVGAEYDILRLEAQQWMAELAGLEKGQEEDFEKGTYKWILARRCTHLFTHHWGMKGEKKRRREAKAEPVYVEVEKWLKKALEL